MEPGANSSASEMEIAQALAMDEPAEAEAASASAWEWGSLLDFSIEDDDSFVLSWPGSDPTSQMPSPRPDPTPPPPPLPPQLPAAKTPRRVRKRDPRLVCENYLAGRVPCACPELDEKEGEDLEVAEVLTGGRKRGRVGGATAAVMGGVRCQVLGCEADITELKGYHRRHRVCLRCASASSVLIDGEHKRYCQQCGKFHVLPDFDEGKRSCRRKLERHNKRRRRRPTDRRCVVEEEKEHKKDLLVDISSDGEPAKVETVVSNKVMDKEALLESEYGHESPFSSLPSFQNVQSHVGVSFTSSGNAQIDERVDNPKSALSSTFYDNKSVYSSVCPTGRISFKLYDWNPAEFPRRLRHQIFQWLASMPVELEGYIRPGCTILTIFIAMPQFMWDKLSQEMAVYVRDLVNAPESLFVGRGKFLIYLSNMIVQVMRDGTSLMNVKMEVQVPKLHYVYPTYFEAGKSMEFVVCGSNLSQPKFRFLVSFSGKYLVYDSCCAISHRETMSYNGNGRGFVHNSEHEMFRIIITHTEADVFGPAFIEVENESGISNFIPILVGGKHVCSELERMQVAFDKSICEKSIVSQISVSGACSSLCELFESKQTATSELLLDIAWLLKKPRLDENGTIVSLHNFQRLTSLVEFLMQNEFVNILEEILRCLDIKIDEQAFGGLLNKTADIDLTLLQSKMNHAREIVNKIAQHDLGSELGLRNSIHGVSISHGHTESNKICTLPFTGPDGERSKEDDSGLISTPTFHGNDGKTGDFGHRRHCFTNLGVKWHRESWGDHLPSTIMRTRLSVFVLVGVVMCFGACIVFFHPRKAAEFAVTIRRCMFNGTML